MNTVMFKFVCVLTVVLCFVIIANESGAALIGHWTFDEGSGAIAYDSSGNGLNGNIAYASYTTGRIGSGALYFNGNGAYVIVPNSALLVPQTVGISLWFKSSSPNGDYFDILDKGHGKASTPYYAGYTIQGDRAANELFCAYGNGGGFPGVKTDLSWLDGQWHHLAANLGLNGCQLYIDGILRDSEDGQSAIIQNDSDLFFGRHRSDLLRYFLGTLDDIRLYDQALTQEQVNVLVPEPATIALLGLGMLSLRRKK